MTDQQSDFCGESEDAGSTYDEDRVKKLFQACDGDGDGYIDSGDLMAVCRELRLELSLDELLRELGADADGRVSCRDFVRRRAALRPEIDALRRRRRVAAHSDASLPGTDADADADGGKQESWEFDSGLARDLSPEPHALRNLVATTGTSSGNMLQLASELHLAALAALKGEVLELSAQLHESEQERAFLERALSDAERRADAHAQEQAQAHEERVTELHCVIAELRKTIERQRAHVIEEEDDQGSELEEQDVSAADQQDSSTHLANDSEALEHDRTQADDSEAFDNDRTLGDADSSSADIDTRAVEAGLNIASLSPPRKEMATSCHSLQVAALTDETLQLRAQAAAQQAQLAAQRDELLRSRSALAGLRADRDRLRKKLRELEQSAATPSSDAGIRPPSPPATPASMAVVPQDEMPVCKMAERVSLRKLDTHVTGSQLTALGVWSSCVAESLVCEVRDAADLQEAGRELEAERLAARYENARAQNAVLAITLHEAKAQGDRLSLLLAKFESNATALRLALGYSDRATEAYDVLVALLETELGLLLANCRAAGLGDKLGSQAEEELAGVLRRAADNRRAAETVASHLLARLDRTLAGNAIDISAGPWEEYSAEGPTLEQPAPWVASNERRLREHIGRLKAQRSVVRATAVQLESCHAETAATSQPITLAEARKLDLETAVLMQEVMAMREDKAELRARLFLAEKERASLELRLSAQDGQRSAHAAALAHLQAQMLDSEQLLEQLTQDRGLLDGESELASALRRETRLKQRLSELAASLDQSGQAGELRNRHAAELAGHLKAANAALAQTLERTKKKYQARLRRLEQQMLATVERHSQQVRTLEQRIGDSSAPRNDFSHAGGSLSHSSAASETSL